MRLFIFLTTLQIEDTFDCLNGSVWFTALDLKLGYWQGEMDEASSPLMAVTVSPLRFNECDYIPFGLVNASVTFQRLMETCWTNYSSTGASFISMTSQCVLQSTK